MLKAERALLIEFKEQMRRGGERSSDSESTEAALAEIRRRIAELQNANQRGSPQNHHSRQRYAVAFSGLLHPAP